MIHSTLKTLGRKSAITLISISMMSGCNAIQEAANSEKNPINEFTGGPHLDSQLKMNPQEFQKKLIDERIEAGKKEIDEAANKAEPAIPEMSQILATPVSPIENKEKLVSLNVTEDVALKDVLIELGRVADVDMAIDPAIKGGIILRVKDRPLKEVIEKYQL